MIAAAVEVRPDDRSVRVDVVRHRRAAPGNLNVGDSETSPYIRLQGDKDKHRIRFDGFGIDTEGAGILDGAFGGLVAGSQVSTSMEFFAISGNYGYQIARGKNYRVAVGAEVAFYSLDVGARSAVGRETVQTEGFVPMPFAEVEGLFGPFTLGANAAVMDVDLGDAGGFWFDAEAYLRFQITQRFDVMGGYRYIQTDVEGQAGDRDFEADIYVQGLFATAGVTF